MLKIAEMRGDVMSRFHNALYLGDAEERVKVLESTNNLSLAYLAAAVHGLEEDANRILEWLQTSNTPIPTVNNAAPLLQPPTPIIRGENWPLLAVKNKNIDFSIINISATTATGGLSSIQMTDNDGEGEGTNFGETNKWGDDDEIWSDDESGAKKKPVISESSGNEGGKGWADDDDLDLSDDEAGGNSRYFLCFIASIVYRTNFEWF